jgi:surface protein
VNYMSGIFYSADNFNQNLSDWCVLKLDSEPSSFASNSALADENYPNWGTCSADNTPPVITITGYTLVEIELNATFTDPGATAVDALEGDISSTISVSGTINNEVAGDYILYYSATDHNNNTGTASRTVRVVSSLSENESSGTFSFDTYGVTVLCPEASVGATGTLNDKVYTAVDNSTLSQKVNAGEDLSCLCTSLVTNMASMFGNKSFDDNISSWDTSNVTTMYGTFNGANFSSNISNWDTSSVTNMQYMFSDNLSFNQDISEWDVSSVTNMEYMFSNAISFNQDIGDWDTSNVSNMYFMLYSTPFNQDIGELDTLVV